MKNTSLHSAKMNAAPIRNTFGGGEFCYVVETIDISFQREPYPQYADTVLVSFLRGINFHFQINSSHMEKATYETPAIELLEIRTEQGFAVSVSTPENGHDSFSEEDYEW